MMTCPTDRSDAISGEDPDSKLNMEVSREWGSRGKRKNRPTGHLQAAAMDLGTRRCGSPSWARSHPPGRRGPRVGAADGALALGLPRAAAGFSFLPDESAGSGGSGQRGGSEAQRGPQRGSYAPVHTSESGPAGTDRETTLERVARQLRHGLFGVLFTMNKNSGSGPQAGSDRLDLALMMIDFLQVRVPPRPAPPRRPGPFAPP